MTNYNRNWTIEKQRAANRKSYYKHRDARSKVTRNRQIERRKMVIEHYGGKCECCGEDTFEFLAIDHIGGRNTRKGHGTSTKLVSQIIKEGYPKGIRVLCHNCNQATTWGRKCPHELLKENK